MVYENLSREELRDVAKKRGISNASTLSRPKLVQALNALDVKNPVPTIEKETVKELVEEINKETTKEKSKETPVVQAQLTSKKLSPQAINWKQYLDKLGISPKDYLIRYPDHINKRFIEELLN